MPRVTTGFKRVTVALVVPVGHQIPNLAQAGFKPRLHDSSCTPSYSALLDEALGGPIPRILWPLLLLSHWKQHSFMSCHQPITTKSKQTFWFIQTLTQRVNSSWIFLLSSHIFSAIAVCCCSDFSLIFFFMILLLYSAITSKCSLFSSSCYIKGPSVSSQGDVSSFLF